MATMFLYLEEYWIIYLILNTKDISQVIYKNFNKIILV
jgi:hypothetical protein